MDLATPNRLSLGFHSECSYSHQKVWLHYSPCVVKNSPVPLGFIAGAAKSAYVGAAYCKTQVTKSHTIKI